MKSKNLIILAAVVIAVLAYILVFERHRPTSEEIREEADRVLQGFERDDVTAIIIEREAGRVRLERTGETWQLREPMVYPADGSTVSSTLGSLANLDAERRLAAVDVDPADYGLDDPAAAIRLVMADGAETLIEVGEELPLGSNRALRLDGGGEVIVTTGWFMSDLEREIDDWRSRDVADLLEDDVASIDIESGADSIRAVRIDDSWQLLRPLEDMGDGDHLGSLVTDLASMRIEEFLDDKADLSELGLVLPEYEVTVIRTDGGPPLRLDLGVTRESDTGTEVACRRGDGDYFWASERVRTRLSKAPVLWRSKKVMPFETWDVEMLRVTTPDTSTSLALSDGFWRFADDAEANLTAVQERLRNLAELEATDYDLMAPLTPEMGTVEIAFEADDEESEGEAITFAFYQPLSEGGRAMVQVSGRRSVLGVEVADVEAILGDLESLQSDPPEEPIADTDSD